MSLRATAPKILPYQFLGRSRLYSSPKTQESITAYTVFFSKKPCFLVTCSSWALRGNDCATAPYNMHRWNNRTDSLWWSAISTTSFSPKSVVRSWAARRLRLAFIKTLKMHGYAADGSRISGEGGDALMGSAQFLANKAPLLRMEQSELLRQMDHSVRHMIMLQNQAAKKPKGSGLHKYARRTMPAREA